MKPIFVQLQCAPGKTYEVADAIYQTELVSELYSTSGDYDLLMKVYVKEDQDIGKFIQRQVLRAGWHLRADKGVNILTYQVMRGDRVVSRLSGIVISDPGRFIDTVLPINPLLVRSIEAREGASPHGLSP